jgi:hypothetical protein
MSWSGLYHAEEAMPDERVNVRDITDYMQAESGVNGLFRVLTTLEDPFSDVSQKICAEISNQRTYRRAYFRTRIKKLINTLASDNWVDNWNESILLGSVVESEIIRAVILELRERGSFQQSKFDCIARGSTRYTAWRWSVLLRDNFTCQKCGERADLEAHHIVPYHENKELATDVNNGLTLCKDCHKAHHRENGYKTKGGSE